MKEKYDAPAPVCFGVDAAHKHIYVFKDRGINQCIIRMILIVNQTMANVCTSGFKDLTRTA